MVALTVDGTPEAEQLVIQEGAATIRLPVVLGELAGNAKMQQNGITEGWKDTSPGISWTVRIKQPGDYAVTAVTWANKNHPERFGNHDLRVSVGEASVAGTAGVRDLDASADGEAGRSVRSALGRIRIDRPGDVVVRVAAERIDATAGRGLKLQAIELAPA